MTEFGNSSPEPHWVRPSAPQVEKNRDLYKLAYDEGRRAIDNQSAELSAARTRAVQFLAFVGSATAFLVTRVVAISDKPNLFYGLAITATALAALSVTLVALALSPWMSKWEGRVSPRDLLERWIETDVPVASEAKMYRELALHYDDFQVQNERLLVRMRWLYISSIVAGASQVTLWSLIVWIYG